MRRAAVVVAVISLASVLPSCKYGQVQVREEWLPSCSAAPPADEVGDNGSLFRDDSLISGLYTQTRSYKQCMTLTVDIQEKTSALERAGTKTARTSDSEAHVGAMLGLVGEVAGANPNWVSEAQDAGVGTQFGVAGGSKNSFDGSGETSRENQLTSTVTVMVKDVLDNGLLEVEGGRQIMINNEVSILRLHGYVDSRYVTGDGTVPSWRIAEPTIALMGHGVVGDKQITPWLQRALDRIWPL